MLEHPCTLGHPCMFQRPCTPQHPPGCKSPPQSAGKSKPSLLPLSQRGRAGSPVGPPGQAGLSCPPSLRGSHGEPRAAVWGEIPPPIHTHTHITRQLLKIILRSIWYRYACPQPQVFADVPRCSARLPSLDPTVVPRPPSPSCWGRQREATAQRCSAALPNLPGCWAACVSHGGRAEAACAQP